MFTLSDRKYEERRVQFREKPALSLVTVSSDNELIHVNKKINQ